MSSRAAWMLAMAVWITALMGAFACDRLVYQTVSRAIADATGEGTWRFGFPPTRRAPLLSEVLYLAKRMGHALFAIVVSITVAVLAPHRRRQVLVLWLCIGAAAVAGQGLLRPSIAKIRPDALLTDAEAESLRARYGDESTLAAPEGPRNSGYAVFRPLFSGFTGRGSLTFPSGHAGLAFAMAVALGRFFPRGRRWFLLLASATAASRFLMGEHFLSDSVGGALVGFLSATALFRLTRIRKVVDAAYTPVPGK